LNSAEKDDNPPNIYLGEETVSRLISELLYEF